MLLGTGHPDGNKPVIRECWAGSTALAAIAGALQAYRKALELKRGAAEREREARRKRLQRARRIRAARHAAEHALENGDAALDSLEVKTSEAQYLDATIKTMLLVLRCTWRGSKLLSIAAEHCVHAWRGGCMVVCRMRLSRSKQTGWRFSRRSS